jgi:hypothetical protein
MMHSTRGTARNDTPAFTTNCRHTSMTDSGVEPRAGGSSWPSSGRVSVFFGSRFHRGDAGLSQFVLELRGGRLGCYDACRCLLALLAPAITGGSSFAGQLLGLF